MRGECQLIRVTVNHDLCLGDGTCEDLLPEVFVIGEDLLAYVIMDPIPEPLADKVREARNMCPTEAVTIHSPDEKIPKFLLLSIRPSGDGAKPTPNATSPAAPTFSKDKPDLPHNGRPRERNGAHGPFQS